MSTGIGTDNIEIFLTELDALFNIDFLTRMPKENHHALNIVRVGTSGSMQANIPAGAVLASEYALGLDILMVYYSPSQTPLESSLSALAKDRLNLPFMPYCTGGSAKLMEKLGGGLEKGITVTCPGFFGPQGRRVRLEPAIPDMFHLLGSLQMDGLSFTNFEMETAGYYALGRLLGHEVLSLNAIVANRIDQTFVSDPDQLMERLISHTLGKI
jgi:uridine phosphorylase